MHQAFIESIARLRLQDTKVLIAVSGGVDSMVLLYLLAKTSAPIAVAHCNFMLRGTASDADEALVRNYCARQNIPFHIQSFDTASIAANHTKENIQLTARRLRYEWFEDLCARHQYGYIATAHHLNDSAETLLLNLTKGTGIRGLHGIPLSNGKIIRPLSFASKQDVLAYAKKEGIPFREDASNHVDKYQRNLIRNQIVPRLEQINPDFVRTMGQNIERFKELEAILKHQVESFKTAHCLSKNEGFHIEMEVLKVLEFRQTLLFELLHPLGFNTTQVKDILSTNKVGKIFYSSSHTLLVDRSHYIVQASRGTSSEVHEINSEDELLELDDISLHFETSETALQTSNLDKNTVWLDFDALTFPLTVRKWEAGDRFQPLGMQGKSQRLKKYFANAKFSRFQKEATWLLCSKENIVWIVGHRLDERFKIKASSSKFFQVKRKAKPTSA